jgi:hypothetical protein
MMLYASAGVDEMNNSTRQEGAGIVDFLIQLLAL